jgi:hypothetical protein
MIRNSFTKCMEPNCKDPAIYGIHRAVHCTLHVVAGESNLTGKVCTKCGLIDVVDAHGRCNDCDPQAFRRYRLAKQREVKAMLDNSEHKNYVLYDRIIDGGECGKERPDWMWDCGTHQLILECDENNGHKTREEWCECTRMVNISQSAGMPVVFLRYNPDSFVRNGKARNETMNKRRDILFRWIAHLKKTPPVHFLSVMQLFYDEYKEGNESLECILQFDT